MKIYRISAILLLLLILLACGGNNIDYQAFKKAQDYQVPHFNWTPGNKSALFIFPHPDDEVVCGGTIAYLKENGWVLSILTLTKGRADEKTTRTMEWENACAEFGFDNRQKLDLPNNSWDDILHKKLVFWNDHMDSLESIIFRAIEQIKPSLVFTYDDILGGYGHPEHTLSARAVKNVFMKNMADSGFSVQKIMQISLPENLEILSVSSVQTYKDLKKTDPGISLPEPTVAVDISGYWTIKRKAAAKYISQAGTLGKFNLLPDEKDTTRHYKSFDREYYFEINK